jgi:signal transduction histidine kinase
MLEKSALKRPQHQSLLFKLFIVLLGAVGLTYFAFSGFYRSYWNTSTRPSAQPSLVFYWKLFARDLGNDTLRAADMNRKLGVPIGIRGPGVDWRSPDLSATVANDIERVTRDSVAIVLREGRLWGGIRQGENLYMFSSRRRAFENIFTDWLALLPVLGLCCLLGWLTLRHLLRPLRELENGVQAVAEGNLELRLSEKGRDELAGLGRSFNTMTQRLKDRDRARDQLLLDVSHELRSPLTRMRVALEMMDQNPLIDNIRDEVESLGKMVSEILETERLKSPSGLLKVKPENLVELINQKKARFEGAPPGIVWEPSEFPLVPLDIERMRLVIRNLIENAQKYGAEAAKPIEITLKREGNFAVLRVRDHGPGVAKEEQDMVFEPFYRLDRSRSRTPGYGLGLPLCRRIVEAHGGSIAMSGGPGEGTTITVKLPLA